MLSELDQKMLDCFHCFSDPNDRVVVRMSLDNEKKSLTIETNSKIPVAHKMSVEQFLNTSQSSLKAIAKGLYKDIKAVV